MKRLLLATISVILLLTGCYKDDIKLMHKDIESLRNAKVASLSEQAEGIKVSIADLNGMGASLQEFISALEVSEAATEKELAGLEEKIAAFEQSAGAGADSAVAEFIELIKGLDSAVQTELGTIASVAAVLDGDGDGIRSRIEELKSWLDGKFAEKDIFEGTYGTLEIQNGIIDDIENIKFHIEALNSDADKLNEMLKGLVSDSVAGFSDAFSGTVRDNATAILDGFNSALAELESTLSEAGSEDIQKKVGECEESVMAWINSQLDDYYKVSEAEAQVEACMLLLGTVPDGKSLQGEIDDALSALESVKASVNDIYVQAIEDAIKDHYNTISGVMDEQIQDLRENVIAPVVSVVEPLKTQVSDIWTAVGGIEDRLLSSEEQRAAISTSIAILSQLGQTLEEYVEAFKSALSEADGKNYDHLKGLIDELDAIINGTGDDSFSSQIAALKAYIGTLPDGFTVATDWISSVFTALDEEFKTVSKIEEIDTIVKVLNGTLDDQDDDIKNLENKLKELIPSSEDTIKGWVDSKMKLTGYYTAGEIDGLLSAFEAEIKSYFTGGDEELQKKIDAVSDELDKQKGLLEAAYKKAIEDAINDEKGKVTLEIAGMFKDSNDLLADLITKSGSLKTEVDGLRDELDGYISSVGTIEGTIATLKTFLSATGYTSLLAIVTKIEDDLAAVSRTYATKEDLTAVSTYVNGELKTEVDKIAGLVSRLDSVESTLDTISAFLTGFDATTKTLKQQYSDIQGYIAALQATVNGTDSALGLQAQIDAINVALYGAEMDEDNPADDSIMGMLKNAAAVLSAKQLSSISYIPTYLDHKEYVYRAGSKTYYAYLRFLVRPAELASLLVKDTDSFSIKFKPYNGNKLYDLNIDSIVEDDGLIAFVIAESTYTSVIDGGGSVALFYENVDSEGRLMSSFTSEFIPLIVPAASGSGKIPSSDSELRFPAEGGSQTITVGDENSNAPFWLVHDQGDVSYLPLRNFFDQLTENYYIALFPPDWVHVSPEEPNQPTILVPWRKYYIGKNELTITVDENPNKETRTANLVFRVISIDLSTSADLVIKITQDGKTK